MGFGTPDGYSHVLELHMEEFYIELEFEKTHAAPLKCDIFCSLVHWGRTGVAHFALCKCPAASDPNQF
jgi:hypothetical protein